MSLIVKGEKEKVRKLAKIAEDLGLKILLFSEEDVDIKFSKDFDLEKFLRLIRLPPNLRETYVALMKFDKATAQDISSITGRARAVEAAYLNRLKDGNYIQKEKVGVRAYFWVEEKYRLSPSFLENFFKKV